MDANTPPPSSHNGRSPLSTSTLNLSPPSDLSPDEPGFAPNAFSDPAPPPASAYAPVPHHRWYDRILDVMLGEDETLAKNRLALLCSHCRLVNGQAPPGTRSLEEIGRWRCGSCGAWNGVERVDRQAGRLVEGMARDGEGEKGVERDRGDEGWTKVSRGDEDGPDSLGTGDRRARKEDGDGDEHEAKASISGKTDVRERELPDSAEDSASSLENGEEDKKNESVAARVAKSKRGSKKRT